MEIFTLLCPNFYKRQKKAPNMGSESRVKRPREDYGTHERALRKYSTQENGD